MKDKGKDMRGVKVEAGEEDGRNIITPPDEIPAPAKEAFERMDAEVAEDAAEAEEVKRVLAMTEAAKHYAVVAEACLEEARRLVPLTPHQVAPAEAMKREEVFQMRRDIARALFDRATRPDAQVNIDQYLDRLISWYEAKDNPPGEAPAAPSFPSILTPPGGYVVRVSPTERLASLFMDFLESRVGVIFGELKEDRDETKQETSGAPGA